MQNEHLFRFPESLPNDLEDFFLFYPRKFPPIVDQYKKLIAKVHLKPKEFREHCFKLQKELFAGFEKIKKEFDLHQNKDLKYLVKTDQRLHKLFCYRFWIINYMICDGPIHDYYVTELRKYAEEIAEWEEIEEKEFQTMEIERCLLQSDYVDLYLEQTFDSLKVYDCLYKLFELAPLLKELETKINKDENKETYKVIDQLLDRIETIEDAKSKEEIENLFFLAKEGVKLRGDKLAIYNLIIHSIQFRDHSLKLKKRHESMKSKIAEIFSLAKQKLNPEEFQKFTDVCQMSRNLIEAKDIFGEIDPMILPFWFDEIFPAIAKLIGNPKYITGHSSVFRDLVWHLPKDLKNEVMSPDLSEFSLETL